MLKCAISDLKQAAIGLPNNTMPTRKAGTGTKKRTSDGTNAIWPRDVILNPSINHANLKKKQPMLLPCINSLAYYLKKMFHTALYDY